MISGLYHVMSRAVQDKQKYSATYGKPDSGGNPQFQKEKGKNQTISLVVRAT